VVELMAAREREEKLQRALLAAGDAAAGDALGDAVEDVAVARFLLVEEELLGAVG